MSGYRTLGRLWRDARMAMQMPRVTVDLMTAAARDNDPFYARMTEDFLNEARRRHPRFPLIRRLEYGVCLYDMRKDRAEYSRQIEASGRRNMHRALERGYEFQPINYNDWLHDIAAIRGSAPVRQGEMPHEILSEPPAACRNPPSRNPTHAYPYFGVVKDGVLVAYAGVLIAGELAMIEHILGHAAHQSNGVVPLLLIGMEGWIRDRHRHVRYYGYGTWFGASDTLRRFKKKFLLLPRRVRWQA